VFMFLPNQLRDGETFAWEKLGLLPNGIDRRIEPRSGDVVSVGLHLHRYVHYQATRHTPLLRVGSLFIVLMSTSLPSCIHQSATTLSIQQYGDALTFNNACKSFLFTLPVYLHGVLLVHGHS
jgi:hypothetical protein